MTPELRSACELVFQEHKTAPKPVNWKKDAFRGRLSIGLSEMAKDTLFRKQIILFPDKTKKFLTQINPAVAGAASFEEAADLLAGKLGTAPTAAVFERQPSSGIVVAEREMAVTMAGPSGTRGMSPAAPGFTAQILAITDYLPKFFATTAPAHERHGNGKQTVYWIAGGLAGGVLVSWLMDVVTRLLTHH